MERWQTLGVRRAAQEVQGLHHPLVLLLGEQDDGARILPRDMESRPIVAHFVHVSGQVLAEGAVGNVSHLLLIAIPNGYLYHNMYKCRPLPSTPAAAIYLHREYHVDERRHHAKPREHELQGRIDQPRLEQYCIYETIVP